MNRRVTKNVQEFTFVIPTLILFGVFVAYPFFQGFPMSFQKWDGMSPEKVFVGFSNYVRFFKDPNVWNALRNTLVFTIVSMIFANILGLLLALMISKNTKINNMFRTIIFIPYSLSLVLSAYIWRYVFSDVGYGLLNIPSPLGSTRWVMVGLAVIAIWRDSGYCMVVYIAAIQGISLEYYEAAKIEGCSRIKTFRFITLPMIGPAITSNMTLLLAWGMKVFDYPMAATGGGPGRASETMAMLIYNNLFTYHRAGYGQAIAIIFTALIFFFSIMVSRTLRSREVEV